MKANRRAVTGMVWPGVLLVSQWEGAVTVPERSLGVAAAASPGRRLGVASPMERPPHHADIYIYIYI